MLLVSRVLLPSSGARGIQVRPRTILDGGAQSSTDFSDPYSRGSHPDPADPPTLGLRCIYCQPSPRRYSLSSLARCIRRDHPRRLLFLVMLSPAIPVPSTDNYCPPVLSVLSTLWVSPGGPMTPQSRAKKQRSGGSRPNEWVPSVCSPTHINYALYFMVSPEL